jgi:hypothetical protein
MSKKLVIAGLIMLAAVLPAAAQNRVDIPSAKAQGYGANILRIAPITAMDVGLGFGLGYEYIFGEKQMIGLVLPVSLLFENKNTVDISTPYNNPKYNTYVYFTPGIKIYPFGQRKVTYAVGPNLMLGYGGGSEWQPRIDLYGAEYLDAVRTMHWRVGLLVNNYVNFQFTRHFNLGIEGGLGMRYLDKVSYSGSPYYAGNGTVNNGVDITGQFSLTLGYRF